MQYEKPSCNAPIVDHVSNKLQGVMKYNLPNKHTYSSGALQVCSESLLRSYYEVCCHYAKQHNRCV